MMNVLLPLPPRREENTFPLAVSAVSAGFPSPAEDHLERRLDLNEYLVQHPAATFFVRVSGDSMVGAGVFDGDLLVVDRALEARSGHVVVAAVNGELLVKRLQLKGAHLLLTAENPEYPPLRITENSDLVIWGVVTAVIHKLA